MGRRRGSRGIGRFNLFLALIYLTGCGGSSIDRQIPSAISDLAGRALNDSTIVLTWSAPGVGSQSSVSGYDIRYSETAAGLDSVERYVRWPFFGRPAPPASPDSVVVAGLRRDARYFFRAWGLTSAGEPGEDGNIAEVSTLPDTAPPGRITDLAVTSRGVDRLTLTWTAPGDDGNRGRATAYRIAIEPGAHDSVDLNRAIIQIPTERPYQAGVQQQATVLNLDSRASYTIIVLTRDELGQESLPSNVVVCTTDRRPQDWYVYADGSGDAPTIQAAIDSTRDGEIVWIGPGTYRENLRILDQPENLRSLAGPEMTIIDGSTRPASVIEIRRTLRDTTRISGLTITGGTGTSPEELSDLHPSGGGIFAQNAHLVLSEVTLDSNGRSPFVPQRTFWGGGMYFEHRAFDGLPELKMSRCTVSSNIADANGGGVGIVGHVKFQISQCDVVGNSATGGDGGGLWLINLMEPSTVSATVVDHNTAGDHGGGLYAGGAREAAALKVTECLISSNFASQSDGIRTAELGAGLWVRSLSGSIEGCTVVANGGPSDQSERGGGLALDRTRGFVVSHCLFAFTLNNSAIAVFDTDATLLDTILFWRNAPGDLWTSAASVLTRDLMYADPLFCDPMSGTWAISEDSPALRSSTRRIGAPTDVGCDQPVRLGARALNECPRQRRRSL